MSTAQALSALLFLLVSSPGTGKKQEGGPHAAWLARLARDGRRVELADTDGLDCIRCHLTVAREWSLSAHATAWQDEHFTKELRRTRKKERCTVCHAPVPLALEEGQPADPFAPPRATREAERHLGVDCRTCHLAADGETLRGPWGRSTRAHPTQRSSQFTEEDSSLCLRCHGTTIGPVIGIARDFVSSDQAGLDLSCIGCHMPRLRGSVATLEGEPSPIRPRRSHRLETPRDPRFLARAFGLSARVEEGHALLAIENLAGHRVPGTTRRELTLRVELIDRFGDVVAVRERVFDHRHYLPVEQTVTVEFEEGGAALRVRGLHQTEGMRRPQEFLDLQLPLGEDGPP